jgi:thiol-disulfide isomerase/thioredoxin
MNYRAARRFLAVAALACVTIVGGATVANGQGAQAPLQVGTIAPDFTLMDRHGEAQTLSQHRGDYVLLDFWATWCGPCRAVMPRVQALHEKYQDRGLVVYGVNMAEKDPQDAVEYVDAHEYTYGLLLEAEEVAKAYQVNAIPTLFLIDPDGKIIYTHQGVLDGNMFEVFVANAMKKNPPRRRN